MIKLTKRPAPPQPIATEKDYRSNPNFNALVEDCFGKCYICEDRATTLNVEHRVPHRGDDLLKYDWQNLFLSCGHCNNIKGDSYDDILDPTKCDPEDHIALSMTIDSLVEEVLVEVLSNDKSAAQTGNLLKCVYNGGTTAIKEIECANLRNAVSSCLSRFLQYVKGYRDEPDLGYDVIIEKEISKASPFASFKRKIVRDDVELSAKFSEALI